MPNRQIDKYYFNNSEVWEGISKIHNRFKKETNFLINIFKKYNPKVKNILDVGCGTGSHLNELYKKGFTGLGIDLNSNMISYATSKYKQIKFEIKDMKNLNYKNKFDAIICLCTTFCYNLTNNDIASALKSFNKSLKKGGLLIIETLNPVSYIDKRDFAREKKDKAFEKLGLRCFIKQKVDENNQLIIEKREMRNLGNNKKLKTDVTKFRMFFPKEMVYFLETNSFEFLSFYGSYKLNSKQLNKSRLITISKKI